jgi:hypothetical protein
LLSIVDEWFGDIRSPDCGARYSISASHPISWSPSGVVV